jgi:hypothetical protein
VTIREDFLPVVDWGRGLLDAAFGLRRYDVVMVVTTWSGALPGDGTASPAVETPIVVAGSRRPKVEQLTQRDIVASGGLYQEQDLRVGPLTPAFTSGGLDVTAFDPAAVGPSTEVLFRLTGPGTPATGALYRKVGQSVEKNFHYSFVLRRLGVSGAAS